MLEVIGALPLSRGRVQGALGTKGSKDELCRVETGLFQDRMEVGSEQREPKGMLGGC